MPGKESLFEIYRLPDSIDRFKEGWDVVYLSEHIKNLLLDYVETLHRLSAVRASGLALRRAILLYGPPGCGKTSLAMGLPAMWSLQAGRDKAGFIHVNTHALFSGVRGKGQENVVDLFRGIGEQASIGYQIFVLIDEVETLGTDRANISLEANPLDALFQVTAFFESLDRIAREANNVIFIFTTNIPKAIDRAVRERVDFAVEIPLPRPEYRSMILMDAIRSLQGAYDVDELLLLAGGTSIRPEWSSVIEQTDGLSGRTLRHLLVLAATMAVHSRNLRLDHLRRAIALAEETEQGLLASGGAYLERYQQPAGHRALSPAKPPNRPG